MSDHDELPDDDDRAIDAWHDGYMMHRRGEPRPDGKHEADGWDHRANGIGVRVAMIERPEGYYHAPVGTFE